MVQVLEDNHLHKINHQNNSHNSNNITAGRGHLDILFLHDNFHNEHPIIYREIVHLISYRKWDTPYFSFIRIDEFTVAMDAHSIRMCMIFALNREASVEVQEYYIHS